MVICYIAQIVSALAIEYIFLRSWGRSWQAENSVSNDLVGKEPGGIREWRLGSAIHGRG